MFANLCSSDTKIPLIYITDTGKWVAAILAEPEKYNGSFFAAGEGLYTYGQIAEIMSKVTGKTVTHQQVPDEVFHGWLPKGGMGDALFEMYLHFRDVGYYGPNMEKEVSWALQQALDKPKRLEEFLRAQSFQLP